MNNYNEKWTREKYLEYRKLKKSGYTEKMLVEHFGDDIYQGFFNRNGSNLPKIYLYKNFINEIKISPEKTHYDSLPQLSKFYKNKTDYILTFNSNNISYIIYLMYFKINDIGTYNIIFTTSDQWIEYIKKYNKFFENGKISEDEFKILDGIIGKETKFGNLFPVLKKLSFVLLDFYNSHLSGVILSIGETGNEIKIKLYRNIIENSFKNIKEKEIIDNNDGNKYYLYVHND